MREKLKCLIAKVLVFAIIVQVFNGVSLVAQGETSGTTYRELTFTDWGIADGTTNDTSDVKYYSLKDSSVITMEGTAFTGKITFSTANVYFGLGTSQSPSVNTTLASLGYRPGSGGLIIRDFQDGNSGATRRYLLTDKYSTTTLYTIRLTFDKAESGLLVTCYLDGEQVVQYTSNASDTYPILQLQPGATVYSVVGSDEVEETEYREITFKDLGLSNGTYSSQQIIDGTTVGITSLDKIAFSGILSSGQDTIDFRIGAKDSAGWTAAFSLNINADSNNRFWIADYFTGKNIGAIGSSYVTNRKHTVRVTFDYVESDVNINVYLDGLLEKSYTCAEAAETILPTFLIAASEKAPYEVKSANLTGGENHITLSNFGVEAGTLEQSVSGTLEGYDTVADTIFRSQVVLSKYDGNYLQYGGQGAGEGLKFVYDKENDSLKVALIGEVAAGEIAAYILDSEIAGVEFFNKAYNLKITTEIENETDIKFGIYFNNVLYNNSYFVFRECAQYLGNQLFGVLDEEIPPLTFPMTLRNSYPEFELTRITISDFGLYEGQTFGKNSGSLQTADNVNNTYLDMKVNFGDDSTDYIRYGGTTIWYGMEVTASGSKDLKIRYIVNDDLISSSYTILAENSGMETLVGKDINLGISTQKVDADKDGAMDDVKVGIFVEGKLYDYFIWADLATGMGKNMLCYNNIVVYSTTDETDSETMPDNSDIICNDLKEEVSYIIPFENGATVDGIQYRKGDVISKLGVHNISYVNGSYSYDRKLILYKIGDVTTDGNKSTVDLIVAKKYLAGTRELGEAGEKAGDFDFSERVEEQDIAQLRRYLVLGDQDTLALYPIDGAKVSVANQLIEEMYATYSFGVAKEIYTGGDLFYMKPVQFGFLCTDKEATFQVDVSKTIDMSKVVASYTTSDTTQKVLNLIPGETYYWQLTTYFTDGSTKISGVKSFTTEQAVARTITIEGLSNIRDIGGYATSDGHQIKYGAIYRAGGTGSITDKGIKQIDELGIKTQLDLRRPNGEAAGKSEIGENKNYINISGAYYADGTDTCINSEVGRQTIYQEMQVFLNEDNYPIMFHCSAGRDRTGTLAFLLLAMAGVSIEDIYFDYEISFLSASGAPPTQENATSLLGSVSRLYQYIDSLEGETLKEKTWNYLKSTGLTEDELTKIYNFIVDTN